MDMKNKPHPIESAEHIKGPRYVAPPAANIHCADPSGSDFPSPCRGAELLDDYIRDKQQMARLLGVQPCHDIMMDEIKRLQSQNIKLTKAACPECQGTGMVGDYGPGGIDRPDRRTGNSEAQPCDHSLENDKLTNAEGNGDQYEKGK